MTPPSERAKEKLLGICSTLAQMIKPTSRLGARSSSVLPCFGCSHVTHPPPPSLHRQFPKPPLLQGSTTTTCRLRSTTMNSSVRLTSSDPLQSINPLRLGLSVGAARHRRQQAANHHRMADELELNPLAGLWLLVD